jgi:hypothetical protein
MHAKPIASPRYQEKLKKTEFRAEKETLKDEISFAYMRLRSKRDFGMDRNSQGRNFRRAGIFPAQL